MREVMGGGEGCSLIERMREGEVGWNMGALKEE